MKYICNSEICNIYMSFLIHRFINTSIFAYGPFTVNNAHFKAAFVVGYAYSLFVCLIPGQQ